MMTPAEFQDQQRMVLANQKRHAAMHGSECPENSTLGFKDGISNKVYLLDNEKGAVGEILYIDMRRASDARRLVACWNACKGISTESLEENGVASFEHVTATLQSILAAVAASKPNLHANQ